MASKRTGGIDPQMGSAAHIDQLQGRLAWFLHGAYLGGSKRKRIAQDFGVSPDTAKGWLNGYCWPRHDTFLRMREKWGPDFIRFVYGSMDELDAAVTNLERERRLEDARGREAVALAAAGATASELCPGGGLGGADEAQTDPLNRRRRA